MRDAYPLRPHNNNLQVAVMFLKSSILILCSENSNLKNHNCSRDDFKQLKCVRDLSFGLDYSVKR
jgi:hypothetical protein